MRLKRKRVNPQWLTPLWENKKKETIDRVTIAVERLKKQRTPVTLSAICDTVKALYGLSMSPNTITRNAAAYKIYIGSRSTNRRTVLRDPTLESVRDLAQDGRRNLDTKIARLRRWSKDSLIAKVIQLERAETRHIEVESTLREQILNLNSEMIALKQRRSS